MKKLLSFLFLLLAYNISYASQKTDSVNVESTSQTVERLVDKYSEKTYAAICSLAKSLKQPIEHVYAVLVKQQVVESITNLVIIILAILFAIIGIRFVKHPNADWKDGNVYSTVGGILLFLSALCIFSSLLELNDTITGFVNPEYGAIKDISNIIEKW